MGAVGNIEDSAGTAGAKMVDLPRISQMVIYPANIAEAGILCPTLTLIDQAIHALFCNGSGNAGHISFLLRRFIICDEEVGHIKLFGSLLEYDGVVQNKFCNQMLGNGIKGVLFNARYTPYRKELLRGECNIQSI